MYLEGNYYDSYKSCPSLGGGLTRFWDVATPKVCVESLCNLGGSGIFIAGADF